MRNIMIVVCSLCAASTVARAQAPGAEWPAAAPPPAEAAPPRAEAAPPPAEAVPPPAEAAPAAPPTPPPAEVVYDKGFTLRSGDGEFALKLVNRAQLRVESSRILEEGAEQETRALVPRGRITLDGDAWGDAIGLKVEFDVANKGSPALKDYYVEQRLGGARLRAGQFKRPLDRQELVSDFASAFPERAVTNDLVDAGRDLGLMLHNGIERSPDGLEWAVAVMNGSGEKPRQSARTTCEPVPETGALDCETTVGTPTNVPRDAQPSIVVRVGWNHGGIKGYSEGDLEGGPLRLAVGASYRVDLADGNSDEIDHYAEADALLKVAGFDLLTGVYAARPAGEDAALGALAQAGWFVRPRVAQLIARVATVPDGDERLLEARGGFAWYLRGHAWKWTVDAGVVRTTEEAEPDALELRGQLQLTF